jgi:hypothetical protein
LAGAAGAGGGVGAAVSAGAGTAVSTGGDSSSDLLQATSNKLAKITAINGRIVAFMMFLEDNKMDGKLLPVGYRTKMSR